MTDPDANKPPEPPKLNSSFFPVSQKDSTILL
jgi:hypothetical protein